MAIGKEKASYICPRCPGKAYNSTKAEFKAHLKKHGIPLALSDDLERFKSQQTVLHMQGKLKGRKKP